MMLYPEDSMYLIAVDKIVRQLFITMDVKQHIQPHRIHLVTHMIHLESWHTGHCGHNQGNLHNQYYSFPVN